MQQKCQAAGNLFEIPEEDLEFYRRINVPPPVLSPEERLRRRLLWRNDSTLFYRTCEKTGKRVISMFSPESKIHVYDSDAWWNDDWDATSYGRPYDFSKPFFTQFQVLNQSVPHLNLLSLNAENSKFTNYTSGNKNCYMCFAGNNSEDCYYAYNAQQSKDCSDCLFVYNSELCYECIHSEQCYNCSFCLHSKNCIDSSFLEDCVGCQNCFMGFNLSHKQYYFFNQPYEKEEYFRNVKEFLQKGIPAAKKIFDEERKKYPKRENHNINAENCTGEYIIHSKNCRECYIMAKGCEDCKYILNGFPELKDSYDCCYSGDKASLIYECMGTGINVTMSFFGNLCNLECSYLQYCNFAIGLTHCFGCSNLRKKSYCILNKQYSKEEYEDLLPRIINHMKQTGEYGLFFPPEISPFKPEETNTSWYVN